MNGMHKLLYLIFILLLHLISHPVFADEALITGAGATFPYPLYTRWAALYQDEFRVKINYQALGSGGGIKQIQANTVDFGASDKPLTTAELKNSGLVQFPTVIGSIVPVFNLTGIASGRLQLSGSVLADIYLGIIKKWNDTKIKALNPTLTLPEQTITVVHRSDGSGTTFLFTDYLAKVSPLWRSKVGVDAAIDWPIGIGGKGNEGVAAYVQRINGAIGYVEFAYTLQNRLPYIALQNNDGQFVIPTLQSFKAAAENINWQSAADFTLSLTNNSGMNSWPIIGATFVLMHREQTKVESGKKVLQFFNWAFHHGQSVALQLNYIPLPGTAVALVENIWKNEIKDTKNNAIWPPA